VVWFVKTVVWISLDAIGCFWDVGPGLVLVPAAGGVVLTNTGNPNPGKFQALLTTSTSALMEMLKQDFERCYRGYGGFR